ncbi:MAG: glycosyltransferase [Candidatus Staskawiczbacteria bacterium]|nr:glycosyltransferase [Candidatus Staskawiczbacteria bacterium]
MPKKVSVIIPARNEEKYIQRAIEKYKSQNYPVEVVIVVNDSQDKTYELAIGKADKVLNFTSKIGVSLARNQGAKVATGDIFIFSDADSYLEPGSLEKISQQAGENFMGTPLGTPDKKSIRGSIIFFCKNWAHKLKIYKGVIDGVFFCHRNVFEKVGGFDETKKIAEFKDFIERAEKLKVEYKLLKNCYAITSLRRYENNGYFRTLFFWLIWMILHLLKLDKKFRERYFK